MKRITLAGLLLALSPIACKTIDKNLEDYTRDHSKVMFSSPSNGSVIVSDVVVPFVFYLGDVGKIRKVTLTPYITDGNTAKKVGEFSSDFGRREERYVKGHRFITLYDHFAGAHFMDTEKYNVPFGFVRVEARLDTEKGKFFDEITYEWKP